MQKIFALIKSFILFKKPKVKLFAVQPMLEGKPRSIEKLKRDCLYYLRLRE